MSEPKAAEQPNVHRAVPGREVVANSQNADKADSDTCAPVERAPAPLPLRPEWQPDADLYTAAHREPSPPRAVHLAPQRVLEVAANRRVEAREWLAHAGSAYSGFGSGSSAGGASGASGRTSGS